MSEPVYILKLGLENVRCFGEKAELDLSDGNGNWRQWTVIVGDNGLGKTTLLQVLSGLETTDDQKDFDIVEWGDTSLKYWSFPNLFWLSKKLNLIKKKTRIDFLLANGDIKQNVLIDVKSEFNNFHGFNYSPLDGSLLFIKVFSYGANRFMSSTSLIESNSENSATLFNDDEKLINAEEWLLQLDYAASRDSELKEFAKQRRELVKEMLIELLPDINDIRFTKPTKDNLTTNIEFQTSFNWVRIHELSLGYKTMVA